jgi:hypothetical protein
MVGLSRSDEDDIVIAYILIAEYPNRYTFVTSSRNGGITQVPVETRFEPNVQGNVYGSGLLIDPENKFSIFFTLNGVLLGEFFFGGL